MEHRGIIQENEITAKDRPFIIKIIEWDDNTGILLYDCIYYCKHDNGIHWNYGFIP